jgi:hypothetical protein
MENRELEKAATIAGMLLLVITFIMGILDTLKNI